MDLELAGKTVCVTGSSRGVGRGIARAFLREGARVALTGRDPASLQATAEEFAGEFGPDAVLPHAGDCGQPDELDRLAGRIEAWAGALDCLVVNIGSGKSVPVLSEDDAEWRRVLDVNLLSAANAVRGLLPLLEKNPKPGCIVFVSSICGWETLGCPTAYAAAKSALNSYARTIARPLGRRGVRVNVVSPGNVIFPGSTWEAKMAADAGAVADMLAREVPLNRLGTLDEIADVAVFLASPRAAFVHGANWVVDGGQVRS
jgi:3-oxoacyl-[acyl-carrier protein] reductase